MKNRADYSELSQLIAYEPKTGALTWKPRPRSMFKSDRAFSMFHGKYAGKPALNYEDDEGYLRGNYAGLTYKAHRVAWLLVHGEWPDHIDHANGKKTDNRIANLQNVTNQQNCKNQKRRVTNKTGVPGVHVRDGKYWAQGQVDGVRKHLGVFLTLDEAAEARAKFEREQGFHENHGRAA